MKEHHGRKAGAKLLAHGSQEVKGRDGGGEVWMRKEERERERVRERPGTR